jgi:hypothetical protein
MENYEAGRSGVRIKFSQLFTHFFIGGSERRQRQFNPETVFKQINSAWGLLIASILNSAENFYSSTQSEFQTVGFRFSQFKLN